MQILSVPFSENGHSTTTLLYEATPSLWHYAQFWNFCQIKGPWLHFLLVSIFQDDQTDTLLPMYQSWSHIHHIKYTLSSLHPPPPPPPHPFRVWGQAWPLTSPFFVVAAHWIPGGSGHSDSGQSSFDSSEKTAWPLHAAHHNLFLRPLCCLPGVLSLFTVHCVNRSLQYAVE